MQMRRQLVFHDWSKDIKWAWSRRDVISKGALGGLTASETRNDAIGFHLERIIIGMSCSMQGV